MTYLHIILAPMKNPKKEVDIGVKFELSENEPDKLDLDPGYEVIFTYTNATIFDKKRLYHYFRKYRREDLKDGEWFEWNKKLYGFFFTRFTIFDIRSAIPGVKIFDKQVREFQDHITPIVNVMVENRVGISKNTSTLDLLKSYITDYRFFVTKEEFIDYLQTKLKQADMDLILTRLREMKAVEKEVEELTNILTPHDKMEYVCKLRRTMEKDKFDLFLNSIPYIFKYYYTFLEAAKVDEIELQECELKKSYTSLLRTHIIDVKLEIHKRFNIGDKLSGDDVLIGLATVDHKCGVTTSKTGIPELVSKLKNYFDIRPCQVLDPKTGEQVDGFELLKKKLKVK